MNKHGIWRTTVWTEHSLTTELLRDEVSRGHRGPNIYFLLWAFRLYCVSNEESVTPMRSKRRERYIIKLICYVINHKVLCLWSRVLVSSVNIHETMATNWLTCKSSKISDPVFDRGWGFHIFPFPTFSLKTVVLQFYIFKVPATVNWIFVFALSQWKFMKRITLKRAKLPYILL